MFLFDPPNLSEINYQVLNERMAQEVAAVDTHEAVSLEPVIQGSFTAALHSHSSRHAELLNTSKLSALGGCEFSALVKGIFNSGGCERAESHFPLPHFPIWT